MILGITGGFGCGKSTAARLFEERGFRRLDSDELVREKVLTDPAVISSIGSHFGPDVVGSDGRVDRPALARIVFARDAERIWLEELTHPVVFGLWREALASDRAANWVVEAPLLFERSLENWFDFTVCIACSFSEQIVRLERRGLNPTLAGQRISKQLPLARKIELADFVIWNDGSTDFLQTQVDRLIDLLGSAAAGPLTVPAPK